MKLIRLSSLLTWKHFKYCRELIPNEYIDWNIFEGNIKAFTLIFISHRWITINHPDPNGNQLRELQNRLNRLFDKNSRERIVIFYDYCSTFQRPRTPDEDIQFYKDISDLGSLLRNSSKIIILSEG